ncbi:MAG: sugar transferase [Clostridia bacterium]
MCIRIFDICASFFGIILLVPVFLIVALLIGFTSRGGVLFKQVRVGRNGKEFKIWKFRTMIAYAEDKGLQLSISGDCRITKVGKVLRKTKIDELPQLFNVLFGQMSLVGPRPEVPKYVALYNEEQKNVLLVRPGITDIASIKFRNENELLDKSEDTEKTYIEEIMPCKLKFNLEYITKIGLFFNIKLIFQTIFAIIK